MNIDINKSLLDRTKKAYGIIHDIDEELLYGTELIDTLYINDENGEIYGKFKKYKPEAEQMRKQIEKITITPLNRLASMDPLYATVQTECTVSLPYDKWVLSYHFTSLPPNYHVGQIYIPNDTLTHVHKFWLTNHVNYKNMHIINRQLKQCEECALIVEIQSESTNGAPKEMLQYIFDEDVQLSPSTSNITIRTANDINIFVLICSIIILIVNSIIVAK